MQSQLKTTLFFSYFEYKKISAGTGLGLIWMVLEPLIRIAIYIFVFTVVLQVRLSGDAGAFGYAIYILMGLVPWLFISSCLQDGAGLVHTYAGFIRQPNFPYRILPNVILLTHLPAHLIGMVIVLILMGISGQLGAINLPLLIAVYALMMIVVRGVATFLGAVAAVVPDVRNIVSLVLMAVIYLSPILYLPAQLGDWILVGMLNPFSYVLTSFKYALTGNETYVMLGPWQDFAVLAVLALGAWFLQQKVMKTIRQTGIDRVV